MALQAGGPVRDAEGAGRGHRAVDGRRAGLAWREPFSRRARRWARRNRTAVTTAAAAVLVALAGTATVLAVQTRANRDLREANAQTRHERDLARQNFDLARKAVNDYLIRVGQNALLKEQGLHELRQELLEAALGYYRDFLRQRGADPSLRADAAAAHERVGDILIELGRPGDALAAYDQALALIEPLVRERPGDPVLATARSGSRRAGYRRGRTCRIGMPSSPSTGKGIGEELLAAGGGTEDLPEILARTYVNAAFVFRRMRRTDEALRAVLRAHALAERATRERPGDPAAARTLLRVSGWASELLRIKGHSDQARRLCERAIAFGEARVRAHPRDVEMRIHLADLVHYSHIEKNRGRHAEALTILRSAADSLDALVRQNPLLVRARSGWAGLLIDLSTVQSDVGRYAEAERSARASIDTFEALVREVPSSSYFRICAGLGYACLGKALLKAGSPGEALAMLQKAIAIHEASNDANGTSLACILALASTAAAPADGPAAAERQRRDADRAVDVLRRAIRIGFADSDVLKNDPDFDSLRRGPTSRLS